MKLTEAQRQAHRDHPAYHEGFFDAQCGDPIFDDATEPYRAGWEAYWTCREILERSGFAESPDGTFSKTATVSRSALQREGE